MSRFIDKYLEKSDKPYDSSSLLGPLSDNIMTISSVAGRFISCDECGTTSALEGAFLKCSNCSASYELKPDSTFRGSPKKANARLLVRGFNRSGVAKGNNWFSKDENWTVAELFHNFLRLPMSQSLRPFLAELGTPVEVESRLEHILFWPRLLFGRKTIQPDAVFVFNDELLLMEFKRSSGAKVPSSEICGQVAFATMVQEELGIKWRLLVVPGPLLRVKVDSKQYSKEALATLNEAREKWDYPKEVNALVEQMGEDNLERHIIVRSWEEVVSAALFGASKADPTEWSTQEAIRSLEVFARARKEYGWKVD